jgi:hypothetical protein
VVGGYVCGQVELGPDKKTKKSRLQVAGGEGETQLPGLARYGARINGGPDPAPWIISIDGVGVAAAMTSRDQTQLRVHGWLCCAVGCWVLIFAVAMGDRLEWCVGGRRKVLEAGLGGSRRLGGPASQERRCRFTHGRRRLMQSKGEEEEEWW